MPVIPQTTVATAKNQPFEKPQEAQTKMLLDARTSDQELKRMAQQGPYDQFNNSLTSKSTRAVGNIVPFFDSLMAGAATKGSGRNKLSATAGRATDWGVMLGVSWLYNKTLGKMYNSSPTMRNFKDENPMIASMAETGVAVGLLTAGAKVYNGGFKKAFKKTPAEVFKGLIDKVAKPDGLIDKAAKHVDNHLPKLKTAYKGFLVLGLGLVAKTFYDIHKTKKRADKNLEQLKDLRYQAAMQELESAKAQ